MQESQSPASLRVPSGTPALDNELGGGFGRNYAIVLGAAPSPDVQGFVRRFLNQVAANDARSLVIAKSLSSGLAFTTGASSPASVHVCGEAVTPTATVSGSKSLDNLTELNIGITEALNRTKPSRVATDILSDLLLRHKALLTRKWVAELMAKVRARDATLLAVINPSMHPREEIEAVLDLFDGCIELRDGPASEPARIVIRWMRDLEVHRKEIPLEEQPTQEIGRIDDNSVAVFDFANIAGSSDADWLSKGISETVTVDLKKISSLKVASREKIAQALRGVGGGNDQEHVLKAGTSLGVKWIVWGGFQKAGNAVRITAHFSDTSTGELVESIKLDGSMDDIFKLQDQIIASLMSRLDRMITPVEKKKIESAPTTIVEAYEWYAKGRQLFTQFGGSGFDQAQKNFEKAIELDPTYALAYSGLGSVHIFRFIAKTDHRDLDAGISHLLKAVEYDPDLVEPHQWLTYAYTRKRQFDKAIEAGQKAIELDPDAFFAQYFLGTAYMVNGATLHDRASYPNAIEHLRISSNLEPNYAPALMNLGWIYMLEGNYEQARQYLSRAAKVEESVKQEGVKFVGGLAMMGNLSLRQGQLNEAADLYRRGLEVHKGSDHMYQKQFTALTYSGLGDLAWEKGMYDEALGQYKQAIEDLTAHAKGLGVGFYLVKAHLGMSKAFYRLGMKNEAERELREAIELFDSKHGYDFSWIWEGSDAEAHYQIACSLGVMNRTSDAIQHLQKAFESGWRDTSLIENAESFRLVRSDPGYQRVLDQLHQSQT